MSRLMAATLTSCRTRVMPGRWQVRVTRGLLSALAQLPPLACGQSVERPYPICLEQPHPPSASLTPGVRGQSRRREGLPAEAGPQPLAFGNACFR